MSLLRSSVFTGKGNVARSLLRSSLFTGQGTCIYFLSVNALYIYFYGYELPTCTYTVQQGSNGEHRKPKLVKTQNINPENTDISTSLGLNPNIRD